MPRAGLAATSVTEAAADLVDEIGFWGNVVPQHVFEPAGSVATFANDGSDGGWVSAGPYVLTDVQVGQSYSLERTDSYPLVEGGVPIPAQIVYRVLPDVNTEILALQSGEVAAAAGQLSQFESVLAGDERFAIEPLPVPRLRDGWIIGCAVKREATDLALAVQGAVNALAAGGDLGRIFAKARLSWRAP